MSVEGLLNEQQSLMLFRFQQVEKDFIRGVSSNLTAGGQSACCNKSPAGKNKAKKNANASSANKQSATASSTTSRTNCDDNNDPIVCDIAKARKNIQLSLASSGATCNRNYEERIQQLEAKVVELESATAKLMDMLTKMTIGGQPQQQQKTPAPAQKAAQPKKTADDDDDDIDLFGSDEDEEANELHKKRVEEYAAKKAKKPAAIAKSSVVLDIKPWDDETDMEEMQRLVRTVEMDGLVWGASKLVPLAYGIKKLQIVCVIEDEKVSVEELSEKLQEFEDHVQSVDVAAFNKI